MTSLSHSIQFGTSGHRGIIGETFTTNHIIAIAQAIYTLFTTTNQPLTLIIGYDPRTGNDPDLKPGSFTEVLTRTLINLGFTVYFCNEFCPTPVISWAVTQLGVSGGLILTASHNPPSYNGIKFNPSNGAPAPTSITQQLQALANTYLQTPLNVSRESGKLIKINPIEAFSDHCITLVSNYFPIKNTPNIPIKIIIDCKHGATEKTWESILKHYPVTPIFINKDPKSNFGGIEPNPTIDSSISEIKKQIIKQNASMGFANDPDGDRHVIIDETGTPLSPEQTGLIIASALIKAHFPLKTIGASVASSKIVKEFCTKNHLQFKETPVGFKYFADLFTKIEKQKKIALAIESSGGFSLSTHTYEKCGFLPCLLILNLHLQKKISLSSLKKEILQSLSKCFFLEKAISFRPEEKEHITEKINQKTKIKTTFKETKNTSTKDGLKIEFKNGDWILFRLSGTEPVARIYCESNNKKNSHHLLEKGKQWLLET